MNEQAKTLCILGPTATGKSSLAMSIAARIEGVELVSVDSMQVYREMNIGTAKPTLAEQGEVPHHLIDIADPSDDYDVSTFQSEWRRVRDDVAARGRIPVLVGGTGLYLRSVVDDLEIPGTFPDVRADLEKRCHDLGALYGELKTLDPLAASRIDPDNARRIVRALEVTIGSRRPFSSYGPGLIKYPEVPFTMLGLRIERPLLDSRIDARYTKQMSDGFLAEVAALAERPGGIGRTARQALGYRELLRHVEGAESLDDMLDEAKLRTRRFARRQLKWFQRDPRIEWFDLDSTGQLDHTPALARAIELLTRRDEA